MRGIAIARGIGTPPILMAITWAGLFLLFYLGPAEYQQSPSVSTWLLAALGLVIFSIACAIALSLPVSGSAIPATVIEKAILLSSALGLIGAALIVLDKVLLSGLDYSQGLTSVRYMRIDQINAGIEIERSPLLYLSYLTFSFSYASVTLYFLEAERVRSLPSLMASLTFFAPISL